LKFPSQTQHILLITLATCMLVACGGGGSATATLGNFSITGTAATGAAISNGTVEARCKNGLGTATTNYDGTFTVDINNGSLPCILKAVDPVSNLQLHSVIEDGASKANISPLTELVSANLLGDSPSNAFANFTSDAQGKISSAGISNSVTKIQAATAAIGSDADMTGIDLMKGTFRAATELAAGDTTDKKIDALMATLAAADKKVSDLTKLLMAATSTNEAASGLLSVVGNSVDSLANCPNARSGDVWVFGIVGGAPLAYTADFKNMRLTKKSTNTAYAINQVLDSSGRTISCAFSSTISGVNYEYRISDGGLVIAYTPTGGMLIIPAQKSHKFTDASFAGTYPAMAFIRDTTSNLRFALPIRFEIDSNGKLTGYSCDLSKAIPDCLTAVDTSSRDEVNCVANADGTYSCSSSTTGLQATAALYLTGSQATMLMSITNMNIGNSSYEGMIVMTKAGRVSLPSVGMGSPAGAAWNIGSSGSTVTTSYSYQTTVSAINATNNSFSSTTSIPGNDPVTSEHYLDAPAKGFIYSESNVSKAIQLRSPSGWSVAANKMAGATYYSYWNASIRVPR
jgi:hypothetical protein